MTADSAAMSDVQRSCLMPLGNLPVSEVEERLLDARRTYRLNLGYAGLTQLPPGFVDMVKKFNPHITELELSSNNLTDLPDDLEELRYIRILRVKYNQLKRLPAVVTRLPQLMVFEMSGNQVTRVEDNVGNMTQLKELDLSSNLLTHLSDSIGHLPKLEVLELENNRLEVLPETLGELPNLVKLDLSTNSLRFLPASLGNYKKLQRIDVGNNLLARVPPSMGHLKLLKEFNLRYNSLDDRYKAKVEEGLSRLLAFLREEEERERLEEIERLKPIGTPVGSYLEYRCKAEVGQVVRTEAGEITVDNRSWVRTGHTLTQVGNMLVMFGGTLMKDGTTVNDVFWMTLDRMEWHCAVCKGDRPAARFNHCAVYDEENNRLVVFGGRNSERKRLSDIFFLELESFTWCKPACEGVPPSAREQAVATFWAGNMIVFGGHAIGGRTNDLYLLDLSGWQWSQPATAGTAPSPRQACAITIGHGNLLFIHGGRNNFVLEDLHMLDFVSKTWTELTAAGRMPPPRHSHLITFHKDHLFLYGGQDELGAQSFSMYRLYLPPGESYAVLRPEWAEWESELPYNKCRAGTLYNGSLSLYQLGSNTLGRVNDEDAEKGLVYWDVFKTTRLDNLKPRQLDEEELKPKNAKRLRMQHTVNISARMPRSFVVQSAKETKVLSYVQDYQRIFEELYPHRRQLHLRPRNECNVHKLVCTTLRPTQLSYTELYDLDGCATFVADFLCYEPLEDPLHPPEHLPSPMSVLSWQSGDSFDMSVVLASLLIGVGYNAFVVVGYAPLAVTTNDQSTTTCPVLEREADAAAGVGHTPGVKQETKLGSQKKEEKAAEVKKPKYAVRPPLSLKSKFLAEQEAKALAEEAASTSPSRLNSPISRLHVSERSEGSVGGARSAELSGMCRTVHAWVLVMPGKRDVSEPTFVEPSTGRRYPVTASPYQGVEYLWNNQNVWVCMQMPLPHSDSRAHPEVISWDLSDCSKWEMLFEDKAGRSASEVTGDETDLRALESRGGARAAMNATGRSKAGSLMPRTPGAQGTHSPGMGGVSRMSVRPGSSFVNQDTGTPPRTADNGDGADDDGEPADPELVPEIPPSWVPKVSIPRDAFDMRCPRGSKLTLYQRAQHEIFALFGDTNRYDGMVEKLIIYSDDERTIQEEVREIFQRRRDKLHERCSYPTKDMSVEHFDGGSAYGLKDILTAKGVKRVMNFYHTARLDGLMRREELEGLKLMEIFTGRDDRLIYRSATYQQETLEPGEEEGEEGGRGRKLRARDAKKVLPVRKMTEKFSRDPKVSADKDVCKRVYYLSDGKIRVDFHYGESNITHSSHVFHKDGRSQMWQVDPLKDRPQPSALLEEYQALLLAEKDCMQAIRDSEWEMSEITRTRTNQEQSITLETPYYDIVRIKAEESEEEEEDKGEASYDYLTPCLPNLSGMQQLTRDQALDAREKCLKALKDRLIERANIIQARLDEESASLGKRQQNYQRDRDQMTQEEEEEYEKAVEESMFRIHILEKRLKRHEEQALHKYYELDHRLRSDTRLAALLNF